MTAERTIAFVDLAGFTSPTDVHGDDAAVDLMDDFSRLAAHAVDASGAQLVKTIGDAVMLAAATPGSGLDADYQRDGLPQPPAGLHDGPVVDRGGDYFGATVNLAARVAGRAGSGQALVTATVLGAAQSPDVDVVALGAHQLRNIRDPVERWALELCATQVDLSVDPVCRMRRSCPAAVARVRHPGVEHGFCSLACVAAFANDPDRYLTEAST